MFQPLGTVHIQEEVLQQGLCFLQIPGILWLELKSLALLVIVGILETREDRKKPGWTMQTSQHFPRSMHRAWMLNALSPEEPHRDAKVQPSCLLQHLFHPGLSVGQAGCWPLGLLGGTGLCCCG